MPDIERLAEELLGLLEAKRLKLVVAESCTAGLLSLKLSDAPGASGHFNGGFVTYTKEQKTSALGVSPALLREKGAVCGEVACAMAEGLYQLSRADIVLAETGIAGPIRGRSPKPLGTTCFAMRTPTGTHTEEAQFAGDRRAIQERIAEHALTMIARYLTTTAPGA